MGLGLDQVDKKKTYDSIDQMVQTEKLRILGGFHPKEEDNLRPEIKTMLLLGPDEPKFWKGIIASPEWLSKEKNPIDLWSYRIINAIAKDLKASAFFPFGTPLNPFYEWALRSKSAWVSPVSLLVHAEVGLMVSYRGALGLKEKIKLPALKLRPCAKCSKPCLTSCNVSALTERGYDVPKCLSYLKSKEGKTNLSIGCSVRLSCPVSQKFIRDPGQTAYHMSIFSNSGN
ncbi:MAG: ferredoxin [Proteobacteria bacterium]|nr:ferredoxin [Pseudomonadota bacterium]